MILDRLLEFSSNQNITSDTSSTNIVDAGSADVDLGTGENLYLRVATPTPITGTGSVAVTLREAAATNAAGTALTSPTLVASVGTLNASTSELIFRLPPRIVDSRFLDVNYNATGTVTTGTADAHILKDVDVYTTYRSGFRVE